MQHKKPVELEVVKPVDSDDEYDEFTPEEIAKAKALDEADNAEDAETNQEFDEDAASAKQCEDDVLVLDDDEVLKPQAVSPKPTEVKTEAPVANPNVNAPTNPEDKADAPETLRHRAVVLYKTPSVEFKSEYHPIVLPNCDQFRMPCATVESFTVRNLKVNYQIHQLNAALGFASVAYAANNFFSFSQTRTVSDMVFWRNQHRFDQKFLETTDEMAIGLPRIKMTTPREQKFHAPSRESKNTTLQAFDANLARVHEVEAMYQAYASSFRSSFFHRPSTQLQKVGRDRQSLMPISEEVDQNVDQNGLLVLDDTYTPTFCEKYFLYIYQVADRLLERFEKYLDTFQDEPRLDKYLDAYQDAPRRSLGR